MDADVAIWLAETLRLITIEDASAQIFLMGGDDPRRERQVAVDMLYRCVQSGLVELIPYGDGLEKLSCEQYVERMAAADPAASGIDDWDAARFWIGTYVVGTIRCAELLATYGLLNREAALMLSNGLMCEATASPDGYPRSGFATAQEAMSFAEALGRCARQSAAAEALAGGDEQARVLELAAALERVFEGQGVPVTHVPIFPVSL